jgi:hypothetical protein
MWFNPIMKWLITSPLHPFVSSSMLVITYQGRVSGKIYSLPVNYIQDGDWLYVISWRERTWWRNLRNGQGVELHLKGRDIKAVPQVMENEAGVVESLMTCFKLNPRTAKTYQIEMDSRGRPAVEGARSAAESKVVIKLKVDQDG